MRVVFDTNVLIDGFTDDFNVQSKLIDAVIDGEIAAIYTVQMEREYQLILRRLINNVEYRDRVNRFLRVAEHVESQPVQVQLDDDEDRKFLEAAHGGAADSIVTQDHHLLDLGTLGSIRIMTPQECWHSFEEERGSASGVWGEWIKKLRR
jgi:putative PIN family toxin of toxin-antitoxin system